MVRWASKARQRQWRLRTCWHGAHGWFSDSNETDRSKNCPLLTSPLERDSQNGNLAESVPLKRPQCRTSEFIQEWFARIPRNSFRNVWLFGGRTAKKLA